MIESVKVKNLTASNDNVRRRGRDADVESLAASIAAHGLLQNLVVVPLKKPGHFSVKAGRRRLLALRHLIEQGQIAADHQVQVLVLDDEALSVEASLAENFHRVAMNPADECTAFKHFIDKGAEAEDVAKRFGVTTRFVEQRVRLAELAPCVFDALAAGEISLGVAQAYAVSPDVERQARVFASMAQSYYGNNPDNIRRAVLNGTVKGNDLKAVFVGRDAYVAAGGRIERDLFGEAADESWVDSDLLDELATAKLEAAAVAVAAEAGLGFVTPVLANHVPYDLERQLHAFHPPKRALTDAEAAQVQALEVESETLTDQLNDGLDEESDAAAAAEERLSAIERELDAIDEARVSVEDDLKGQLGTFLFIGADGTPRLHARLFSEQPIRTAEPDAPTDSGAAASEEEPAAPGVRLSATLVDELATQRRQILAAHVASDTGVALDLAIFLIANRIVYGAFYVRDHATVKAPAASFPILGFRDEASAATAAIAEQRDGLDTSWAGFGTLGERFDAFRTLDDSARAAWLAYAVAQSLEPTLNLPDGGRSNGFHDHLGRLLAIDVAAWWRPTPENFFGRVKKDVMLDALQEIGGSTLRNRYKDAKKAELATYCGSLCAGQGIVEAEVRAKALSWLPDVMRFDLVEVAERNRPHSDFLADEEADDGDVDGDTVDDVVSDGTADLSGGVEDDRDDSTLDQAA